MSLHVLLLAAVAFFAMVRSQQPCVEATQGLACNCVASVAACSASPCTTGLGSTSVVTPVFPTVVPQEYTCAAGCPVANPVCCAYRACPGTAGTAGTAGSAGLAGLAGTSGTAGVAGTNGLQGTAGATGTPGTAGAPGFNGVAGAAGTRGTTGTPGTRGSSGTAGSAGLDGATGTAGTAGVVGTSGSAGAKGTSGTAGAVGTAGTAGLQGTGGTAGTEGAVGTSGTAGTAGSAGLTGTAGTAGTAGEVGTFGTPGTAGSIGSAGTYGSAGAVGQAGTGGLQGTSGAAGTAGTVGVAGAVGTAGATGTAGSAGLTGTAGTAGAIGTRGTSGLTGTAGSAGVAGGDCEGAQTVALLVPDLVAAGSSFTATVKLANSPGGDVNVKINLDSKVLQSTTALSPVDVRPVGSVVVCVAKGPHSFVCTAQDTVSQFSFVVQTQLNVQGFADISAFVSNPNVPIGTDDDCAFASRAVEVGFLQFGPSGGQCSCPTNGLITFNADGSCTAKCVARKRDEPAAAAPLAKRQLGVPGARVLAEISVTYRRTDKYSSSFDSDSDSVSRCGPRVSFLVNNKRVWTNGAQVDFGVEGVISGNVEFEVPLGAELRYLIDIKAKDCKGYSLSIWDPQYTVRTVATGFAVNPDSPQQKL